MNSFSNSKLLASPDPKLSDDGKHLVEDFREVIRQAKLLLLSKNEGNLLQDFIWDAQHLDGGNAKLPGAPTDKDTARQHGNEALDGLKTLGQLLLSNGQFRKLLSDATVLLRDMAGDAAQNTASRVKPGEDRLNQIDEPAEENTWHDVPDMSRENIRNQARDQYNKQKPFNRQDAQAAVEQGADQGQHAADRQPGDQEAADAGAREGANTAAQNLKEQARANVPQETQDEAKKAKNAFAQKSRNYMDKKMPQERREQTIWRLKKMIVEIQGHSDCKC